MTTERASSDSIEESSDNRESRLEERCSELKEERETLKSKIEKYEERIQALRNRISRLENKNEKMKTQPLHIATVEEVLDDNDIILKQHGNNQELLTECPRGINVESGDRVAVQDTFTPVRVLGNSQDARAQAMEVDESPSVEYSEIGGLDEKLQEVREAVEQPISYAERFDEIGIEPPSGVLLHGPPGTGKTMMAKAVANNANATFVRLAAPELVQKFIGEGGRLVRDLFEIAEENSPAIIFIDEIDAIAAKRTQSKTSGDAEVQRTLMQLLSSMDGFNHRGDVRLMAATNRFDMLDEALLRPGRFDRLVEIGKPNRDAREEIFNIHLRDISTDDSVKSQKLADETEGFTGAEISSICTEAGMVALRDDRTVVQIDDLLEAIEEIEEGVSESQSTSTPNMAFS